jgi:hypothetical protein
MNANQFGELKGIRDQRTGKFPGRLADREAVNKRNWNRIRWFSDRYFAQTAGHPQ